MDDETKVSLISSIMSSPSLFLADASLPSIFYFHLLAK